MYTHTYVCMYVCICLDRQCAFVKGVVANRLLHYANANSLTGNPAYIYTHMYVCIQVYVHTHMYVCMYVYVWTNSAPSSKEL